MLQVLTIGLGHLAWHFYKQLQRIETMGQQTDAAVAALVEEVTDSTTKLDSTLIAIANFPAVVAQAVADALAAANVADGERAAIIDAARQSISDKVDAVEAAINANTAEDGEDDVVIPDPVDPELPPVDPETPA